MNKINVVIEKLKNDLEDLVAANIIYDIGIDTYQREIARYGSNSIELAESFFCADSMNIIKLLIDLYSSPSKALRWKYAIGATDMILDQFALTLEEKVIFTKVVYKSFFEEYGGTKELKISLDKKFRENRKEIESIFEKENLSNDSERLNSLLMIRKTSTEEIISKILEMKQESMLRPEFSNLISSLIHMMINRLFTYHQRKNELVVYYFLNKHYKTLLARMELAAR